MAMMMDNASNNDTMIEAIESRIRKRSDTYVAYIDLYRSIGWLGYPLLYRS